MLLIQNARDTVVPVLNSVRYYDSSAAPASQWVCDHLHEDAKSCTASGSIWTHGHNGDKPGCINENGQSCWCCKKNELPPTTNHSDRSIVSKDAVESRALGEQDTSESREPSRALWFSIAAVACVSLALVAAYRYRRSKQT